ncbi:hypothetical protein [Streptosporangium amethystogenes]|uniref:hypothetical protein n=1 Tax=Streptosporangium amethystogenes TaxID=2002 RepID=UPI0004C80A81|nr:hypothetical protein [Streptosporangium amethystogenes]
MPATSCMGTAVVAAAVTAEGLVSAAARFVTVRTAELRAVASTLAPPPIECPDSPNRSVRTWALNRDPATLFCATIQVSAAFKSSAKAL